MDEALSDYQGAITNDPDYWEAYTNMGNIRLDRMEIEMAISDYTKAIEVRPTDAFKDFHEADLLLPADSALIYVNRGSAYRIQRKGAAATEDFTRAIEFDPSYAKAYYLRGFNYIDQRNYAQALLDCNRALELDQGSTNARRCAREAHAAIDRYVAKLNELSRVIRDAPDEATGYYDRGNLFLNHNKFDEAIADYTRALELHPQMVFAFFNRGNAYAAKNDYDTAIVNFDNALTLNSAFPDCFVKRGLAHFGKGDIPRAVAEYTKAIQLNPRFADAYLKRGQALIAVGDYAAALEDLTRYISLDPARVDIYLLRADIFQKLGRKDLADGDRKTAKTKSMQ